MRSAAKRSLRLRVPETVSCHAGAAILQSLVHIIAILAALVVSPATAFAQAKPPSEHIKLAADTAYTWSSGDIDVIELSGNVSVATDDARMTAHQAVEWLAPIPGGVRGNARLAQVVLIGDARLAHDGAVRSGA